MGILFRLLTKPSFPTYRLGGLRSTGQKHPSASLVDDRNPFHWLSSSLDISYPHGNRIPFMKALVFDTETSGLPTSYNASCDDVRAWPRIVEIAWIVIDREAPVSSQSFIVRPEGFEISAGASSIHGITTAKAIAEGSPLRYAMTCLAQDISDVDLLVAHNIDFDFPVVNCELIRAGILSAFSVKRKYCTMKSTVELCGIPGRHGPKWPRLEELYRFLFSRSFAEAHRALNDVVATTECYLELKRRGLA